MDTDTLGVFLLAVLFFGGLYLLVKWLAGPPVVYNDDTADTDDDWEEHDYTEEYDEDDD
jgi:hypothetical protein